MTYTVHELFLTAQGEGANLGRVAVFCHFAGCNLWSGREEDRATAVCQFCDTEFRGGTRHDDAEALAGAVEALWPKGREGRMVVLTGGEPLLQVDAPLLDALRRRRFWVALETNGTRALPGPIDWVCVSPKVRAPAVLRDADELKLVYPQDGDDPACYDDWRVTHRWLSPMDGPRRATNTQAAAAYCLEHPHWRLGIQAHKAWGLP